MDLGSLARLGEFLAGVSAPVGIGWVARTFYLQRQQLNASIEAIREQMSQVREQYDRDHTPNFNVQISSSTQTMTEKGESRTVEIRVTNHGAPSAPTSSRIRCIGADGFTFEPPTRVRSNAVNFSETFSDTHFLAPLWSGDVGTLQIVEVEGHGAGARCSRQSFGAIKKRDDDTMSVLPEIDATEVKRLMALVTSQAEKPGA